MNVGRVQNGSRFQAGRSKTGGRKRGTPNRTTHDVRVMAQRLVQDPAYRSTLAERLRSGKAGQMEPLLWNYAYGKPPQTFAIEVQPEEDSPDLSALTTEELRQIAEILSRALPQETEPTTNQ